MTLSIHRIYGIVIFLIAGSVLLSAICQLCFVLVDGAPDFVTLRALRGSYSFRSRSVCKSLESEHE
jgi:hypothetical protein